MEGAILEQAHLGDTAGGPDGDGGPRRDPLRQRAALREFVVAFSMLVQTDATAHGGYIRQYLDAVIGSVGRPEAASQGPNGASAQAAAHRLRKALI